MLKLYISVVNLHQVDYIFRNITTFIDNTQTLRKAAKPITYSRTRELFIDLFNKAGFNLTFFNLSLHSLRAGGASAAANDHIPDRLFKRHGCWVSESAKDGYVKNNLELCKGSYIVHAHFL